MPLENIRIVLVGTTHPGNIGAAARAMKTMGLTQLYLVNPTHYPNAEATSRASGADDLLAEAKVCNSLDEALRGCCYVVGSSARIRSIPLPQLEAREAAAACIVEAGGHNVAVLFGRERYGLTNEEIQRCHQLVQIPCDSAYSSLNLAQAVQLICYELRMAGLDREAKPPSSRAREKSEIADDRILEGFFGHLERTLVAIGYLDHKQPKRLMTRLRRLYTRARPSENEINILRGILSDTQSFIER